MADFDLIILQRCFMYDLFSRIRKACNFLGKPLIFETDDDYLNLPTHNPCYLALAARELLAKYQEFIEAKKFDEAKMLYPLLEQSRLKGLEQYRNIIRESDGIVVSTEELKRSLTPYNKNIIVLQNNVDRVFYGKDYDSEDQHKYQDANGDWKIKVPTYQNLFTIPSWCIIDPKYKVVKKIPRIGYSCTTSHRGQDFDTIKKKFFKTIDKYHQDTWSVFLGDDYFYNQQEKKGRKHFIWPTEYDLYVFNLRNIDVGMAPLETNIFNMSKSDIKAVEHAMWGTPCVLPNMITYTRNFVNEETALFYDNEEEFGEQLERLIKDEKLRRKLGDNAREYVRENRLESLHSEKRFNFYQSMVQSSYNLKVFMPHKELVNNGCT